MRYLTNWPSVLATMAICLLSSSAWAGIAGSAHDFSSYAWSQNQICLPCHTTHNTTVRDANNNVLEGPLWNHQLSTATYTLYLDVSTGQGVTGAVDQNSVLCLSCHDGTVALDSFGGLNGTNFIGGAAKLGTDLSNDHPIGEAAVWPTGATYMVDPAIRDAAHVMPLRTLADGRQAVGCTSCHEPHNRKGTPHMLWINNAVPSVPYGGTTASGSPLCLSCHKK